VVNRALYIFTNDLRVQDNPALLEACSSAKELLCVFIVDPRWFKSNRYGLLTMGHHRWRFVKQSIDELKNALQAYGQDLMVIYDSPLSAISRLVGIYNVSAIFRAKQTGYYENKLWQNLQSQYPFIELKEIDSNTLFSTSELPFHLDALPNSFTPFRKTVEKLHIQTPLKPLTQIPPPPRTGPWGNRFSELPPLDHNAPNVTNAKTFDGGANAANNQLNSYFEERHASSYKQTRNALDGWESSTKFSPWLAHGCVSPKQILSRLKQYELAQGSNASTYWVYFELLWREYFHWLAYKYQAKLYFKNGIVGKKKLTTFYPERFQRWMTGNTPYPLVNACMHELSTTGYLSNRGRQIVASGFVNELQLDWRYGAAYFEQVLIDYDVASNWGNWQYIAGVGADPRGGRHFNLEKQQQLYDPHGTYIRKWQGEVKGAAIDSVDAADWPIS